ncbi:hypothetical protein [Cellulomonas fengjieae]|uniref:Uncharacterized protein n=1 Tax=Cellulomonas fengjieae TaxID=2819978 RepID=A0ABS3SE66_9CELL|nr:hypothetical protein [Cellulomonas fengjieae]MBO3084041.1 hypothetical protein [Cellulomonas fengjieae]MBO3101208.1 hypothetical protein [Cellulomonas fengjieae]QVI64701.1 hypothetical protein KG102_10970 [Cellulomonas fengjieae]
MSELSSQSADDTPALPESTPDHGQPEEGDNQDVAVEKIYPSDPTGAEPE